MVSKTDLLAIAENQITKTGTMRGPLWFICFSQQLASAGCFFLGIIGFQYGRK